MNKDNNNRKNANGRLAPKNSFICNLSKFAPWTKKSEKENINVEHKMSRLLGGEVPVHHEEVTIANAGNAASRRRRSFQVFHWKFMLLSVLFVIGLCGTTVMWFTTIYSELIFKTLTLGNGTKLHFAWKNPPLEPLLCVHVFNYTNVDEFFYSDNKVNKAVKLKVQDVGPYCFRERIERTNIEFRKNETEMSYREKRDHTWDAVTSAGSLNDTVFVPNVLILSVYKKLEDLSSLAKYVAYITMSNSGAQPFIKLTVGEFLSGYEDEVFNIIGKVNDIFSSSQKTPTKFGVLQKRVGLSNDTVVIRTGNGMLDDMGQVVQINNITQFDAWESDKCNEVDGSDGLFFRRSIVQTNEEVKLFHKDSCRSLPLEFSSTEQLQGGIIAHRYKLKKSIFDNHVEENKCFYNETHSPRSGILQISSCSAVSGAPIALSRPHLLYSNANLDEHGNEIIEGLHPDVAEHDFHIDIFPIIGLTVRTLMRMQLNIVIPNKYNSDTLNPLADKTVLPMAWVEMNSGLDVPEKMVSLLYHLSYTMKWAELGLKWTFLSFTLFIAFVLFKMSFAKSPKKELMIISRKTKKANNVVSSVYVPN